MITESIKKYKLKFLRILKDITIIIIGVLLAFYFTKLGENQKQEKYERDVLNQIYFELKHNLIDLEQDYSVLKTAYLSNLKIQDFLNNNLQMNDSLIFDFYWMTKDEYIFPNLSGYENLKSIGVNLISNDSLRQEITMVYNNDFPRITMGNRFNKDLNEFLLPYFSKNFKLNKDLNLKYELIVSDSLKIKYPRKISETNYFHIGYIPNDIIKLKNDNEFYILVNRSIEMRHHKITYYKSSIERTKLILKLIEDNNYIEN